MKLYDEICEALQQDEDLKECLNQLLQILAIRIKN